MNDVVYPTYKIENKQGCPHCSKGFGIAKPLKRTAEFLLVCDAHPVTEGHILLITKKHTACAASLDDRTFKEFKRHYNEIKTFIERVYGPVVIFEHGVTGQAVFHTHVHFLPYDGGIRDIVPETYHRKKIEEVDEIRDAYKNKGAYLYIEVEGEKWLVNPKLATVEFFRHKVANAMGKHDRADWKQARNKLEQLRKFARDIELLSKAWDASYTRAKAEKHLREYMQSKTKEELFVAHS